MVLNLPPWWVHWQHTHKVTGEKRRRNETNKNKLQQAIESQTKAKSKITWRRQVSDPLRNDNSSTYPRQNYAQAKSTNHQKQSLENHKELPLHTCKLPLNQCNSPWMNACKTPLETGQLQQLSSHRQTGHHHRSDRCSTCAQDQHSDRSDWWHRPVRSVHTRAQKRLETTWKPSKSIQQAISSSNFSPLLAVHESSQKCKTFNVELLKINKIQHRMLHMYKWAS
jgi:hypothetical protein